MHRIRLCPYCGNDHKYHGSCLANKPEQTGECQCDYSHSAGITVRKKEGKYYCPKCGGEVRKAKECPECQGTGKEICNNPDHGFIDAIGVRGMGHANGCPCCGNSEDHVIPDTKCSKCNGTGTGGAE